MTGKTNKPTQATATKSICLTLNAPPAQGPRTIVVLGVERGGTSMAAGVLRALGLDMGARAGLNHEDPRFLTDDSTRLTARIKARNAASDVWGFKLPKASLNLGFWQGALRNPRYVIVYRNPLSVADSWVQRRAGNVSDVLERIEAYQGAQRALISSGAPVLLLNYERALADEQSKQQCVQDLAHFAGVPLDHQARALSMITGDGKGYVNLPEHFFLVVPAPMPAGRDPIAIEHQPPLSEWLTCTTQKPCAFLRCVNDAPLPCGFWLQLDLEGQPLDWTSQPLRIFFNFAGAYFPGHCARPVVRPGRNLFWVETSGLARDLGFGIVSPPARLRLRALSYAATPEDMRDAPAAHLGGAAPPERQSRGLIARLGRRIGLG
jgi:hypothetical protein